MSQENRWPEFSAKDNPLETLVKLSRFYGGDPSFVLAGGGNTSVKTDDVLYVKASGCALACVTEEDFVAMDRGKLDALLAADLPEQRDEREAALKRGLLAARSNAGSEQRPSIEALLHNLLPDRFIVHTHSTYANMIGCCRRGEEIARELFSDDVLWVRCVDPGFLLAREVGRALDDYRERTGRDAPEAILMQNHGLIVAGNAPEEIRERTDRILVAIRERVGAARDATPFGALAQLDADDARAQTDTIGPALRALTAAGPRLNVVRFDDSPRVLALACGADGREATAGGPLTPDQIAFSASHPLWFDPNAEESPEATVERLRQALAAHREVTGFPPKIVLAAGLGLFAIGESAATVGNARDVFADITEVMSGAARLGSIQPLPDDMRRFIENWEVERFRQAVAAGSGAKGRAAGLVAVVTGAAQGFGLEIAQNLAREGACVALLDINEAGARDEAAKLAAEHGESRAIGLKVNVADAASVEAAVHEVVRTYGGFDLFISNAGVLRAGSVKSQPPEDFRFVTDINYVGYFLCVQKASPILAIQHLARPAYLSDIIQINSKSGLEGSNRNAAYAGGKFGGIGLTQSFALELIEDGIKVNSICPGNFLDGPLWSDPEKGLFVQYLRTGKVPGAETIAQVRQAYEAKVPMGRGCTTADVMKAIYYVIEQQYETGQAVPVTGGQVMLR